MVELLQISMETYHRRFAGTDVTIGGTLLNGKGKKLGNVNHRITPLLVCLTYEWGGWWN
jgi:hypothetical protein